MGVFCDKLKLGSTAALDCLTGQKKRQISWKRNFIATRLIGTWLHINCKILKSLKNLRGAISMGYDRQDLCLTLILKNRRRQRLCAHIIGVLPGLGAWAEAAPLNLMRKVWTTIRIFSWRQDWSNDKLAELKQLCKSPNIGQFLISGLDKQNNKYKYWILKPKIFFVV